MKIVATPTFHRCYTRLPENIQRKIDKQLQFLAYDWRYPSLQVKKIQGTKGLWEVRVDLHYRLSFQLSGETVILRVVGNHDDVLKNP